MGIADWLRENITDDARALAWFDGDESEPRIRRGYQELLSGYQDDASTILKTTRMLGEGETPSLVVVDQINFFSLCAHHFLPFFGTARVEYLPGDRILGLGKFPRLVQCLSRRFQIQEDLVKEIAEEIMNSGKARGVKVSAQARHLCMCSRGPSDHTVETYTEHNLGKLTG